MKVCCQNHECPVDDCIHHVKNSTETKESVHIEGNPLYCTKNDWHGNQYKGEINND